MFAETELSKPVLGCLTQGDSLRHNMIIAAAATESFVAFRQWQFTSGCVNNSDSSSPTYSTDNESHDSEGNMILPIDSGANSNKKIRERIDTRCDPVIKLHGNWNEKKDGSGGNSESNLGSVSSNYERLNTNSATTANSDKNFGSDNSHRKQALFGSCVF